jgi:hypothetical protein
LVMPSVTGCSTCSLLAGARWRVKRKGARGGGMREGGVRGRESDEEREGCACGGSGEDGAVALGCPK